MQRITEGLGLSVTLHRYFFVRGETANVLNYL